MSASLLPVPKARFFTADGLPLAGGKVYTYVTGTTTPKATYTDAGAGTPNANPVVLDANGEANIWLIGTYTILLEDSTGTQQWSIDGVSSLTAGSLGLVTNSVTNAVDYLTVTPGISGSNLVSLSSTGSDTNISINYITKGSGGQTFYTNGSVPQLQIPHSAASVDYLQIFGGATGSPGVATIQAAGSDTDVSITITPKGAGLLNTTCLNATGATVPTSGIYRPSGSNLGVSAAGALGFLVNGVASAVNYISVTPSISSGGVANVNATGDDTNIGMALTTKGSGAFTFYTNGSVPQFQVTHTASSVNYLAATGSASAGGNVYLSAVGGDTNLSINLVAKGSGNVIAPSVNANTTGSAANVYVDGNGILLRATSSKRYKTDIRDYTPGIDKLSQIRPVLYKSNQPLDGDKDFAGFLAEDIDALGLKEFVVYNAEGEPDALAYPNMMALAVNCIKELSDRIKVLESKLAS